MKRRGRLDELLSGAGVRVVPYRRRRRPRETHARRHLRRLVDRHGEGHVLFVVRTIVETRNNAGELWSETIQAVSDIVLRHPAWTEPASRWLEAFDGIELGPLRARAIAVGVGSKRSNLRALLADRIARHFEAADLFGDGRR